MESVKRGADRQEMHESVRVASMEAGKRVKMEGQSNDLLDRLADDKSVPLNKDEILALLDPIKFVGRAPEQVDQFLAEEVDTVISTYSALLGMDVDIKV
jgi:adenylosuccinate lyase